MSEEDEAPIPLAGGEEEEDLTPLPLADEEAKAPTQSKIRAFGAAAAPTETRQKEYRRAPTVTGSGAVRCRLFHSNISVPSLGHMVERINEWLDSEQVEVKHVTKVVGIMEGKTAEPNIIITVWY